MRAFRRLPFLVLALLFVDFIDEFAAGLPTVGIPGIQSDFDLHYSTAALLVFTGPLLVAWILEPPIFLLADRRPKKWFVCGGLAAMGILALIVGLSHALWLTAGALLLSAAASGSGVTLAQAALMDGHRDDGERVMARWVFMGAAGDLAAPALFWLLALASLGWREAFVAAGVAILAYAGLLSAQRFEAAPRAVPDATLGTREALALAFRDRRLLLWLFGSWLCNLMDELLVAFAALHLRDGLGVDPATRNAILMSGMAGLLVGLVALDRLLARVEPLRLLLVACAGCAVCYGAWLTVSDPRASGAWLFATGVFTGALYPLAQAQAYRALPGRTGMLNAMAHVFTPLDVLLPVALGLLADRFGLVAALGVLLAQPVGLFAITLAQLRRGAGLRPA